jgi:hypothetical protein
LSQASLKVFLPRCPFPFSVDAHYERGTSEPAPRDKVRRKNQLLVTDEKRRETTIVAEALAEHFSEHTARFFCITARRVRFSEHHERPAVMLHRERAHVCDDRLVALIEVVKLPGKTKSRAIA